LAFSLHAAAASSTAAAAATTATAAAAVAARAALTAAARLAAAAAATAVASGPAQFATKVLLGETLMKPKVHPVRLEKMKQTRTKIRDISYALNKCDGMQL